VFNMARSRKHIGRHARKQFSKHAHPRKANYKTYRGGIRK